MILKTALVLGCDGQDGSLLCHSLLRQRYNVVGLSRSLEDQSGNHSKLGIAREIERENADIRDFNTIAKLVELHNPHEIYNLAGQSSVGKSFIHPVETTTSIVNGTLNLLEVARKLEFKERIFFAGSSEIYGNTQEGASIDHPQHPDSPYAIGKEASFKLVKLYREIHNIKCCTGILFNHESHLRSKFFVTQKIIHTAQKISQDKTIKLKLGNIKVIRDWGWAPEYVEAMQLILRSKNLQDYVVCTGKPHSLEDFVEKVFENYDLNWKDYVIIDHSLFRPTEIKKSFGNPSDLYNNLGWKAKTSFNAMIKKVITCSII